VEVLNQLSEVPGIEAWALVGEDGFILEAYSRPKTWADRLISGLGASTLAAAKAVADSLGRGELEELMVEYPDGVVLIVPTGKGPVLVLALDQVATLGRARLLLRRIMPKLREELS